MRKVKIDKYVVKLLKFMAAYEARELHKTFYFFHGVFESGMAKCDETGKPILEAGSDLAALQKFLRIYDENKIQEILNVAHNNGYTKFVCAGVFADNALSHLILSSAGRDYLYQLKEKHIEVRRKWLMTIVSGLLLPIVVSVITNKYLTRAEIQLLQSQIIQIQNNIETPQK